MEIFIHNLIFLIGNSRYFLLFIAVILEGPVVMMGSGFLYSLGQFDFFPMYLILVSGDFIADIGWYLVGYYGAASLLGKFGKFFNITPDIVLKVEKRFKTYQTSILVISKLTMGFGFALATLITAGMLKIPFKKYATINFLTGFIWVAFMLLVGYFFGNIYLIIPSSLKWGFVFLMIVAVIVGLRIFNRFIVETEI